MRYARPLYQHLASAIDARLTCQARNNAEWFDKHSDEIAGLVELLHSGSGIDSGCEIDLDKSTGEKIVITTSYHHMNDGGYYDGWTDHVVTVRPSLIHTLDISISGRNRNDIKEYLHETFRQALIYVIDYDIKRSLLFLKPVLKREEA